jgi:hypothetical protein
MSSRLGRPKLDVTRTVLLGARFTPEEARAIESAARTSSGTKSDWIRQVLLSAAGFGPSIQALRKPSIESADLGSEFLD